VHTYLSSHLRQIVAGQDHEGEATDSLRALQHCCPARTVLRWSRGACNTIAVSTPMPPALSPES
jgi:hypothetical protein